MFTNTTQKQIRNFGKNCTISLSSNMASMNFAQMNAFYERVSPLFNSDIKSKKTRKNA